MFKVCLLLARFHVCVVAGEKECVLIFVKVVAGQLPEFLKSFWINSIEWSLKAGIASRMCGWLDG